MEFQALCFLFIFIFITSCAHQKIPKINLKTPIKTFYQELNKICLASKGKGRMKFSNEKVKFGYHSLMDKEKEIWSVAFDITFHGEEIFRIGYKHAQTERIKIMGDFYPRVVYELRKQADGGKKLKMLALYLKKLAKFLKFYTVSQSGGPDYSSCSYSYLEGQNGTIKGSCKLENDIEIIKWQLSQEALEIKQKVGKYSTFIVRASDRDLTKYQRIGVILEDDRYPDDPEKSIVMDFIVYSCYTP